jgi:hypothetical protein
MKLRQEVYNKYWYFAAERQNVFFRKLAGELHLTNDAILATYKFCNVYRASDRVSQFLIRNVIYNFDSEPEDTLFRIFFFRLLNRNETWQKLEQELGRVSLRNFNSKKYSSYLNRLKDAEPIYGNAFILCANKSYGFDKKHDNHLALLEQVFVTSKTADSFMQAKSLQELFELLRELPLIGNFMAYQLAIDFNYSDVINFSENDFTIPGPGALRGIQKCFRSVENKTPQQIIMYMVENQEKEFSRLGLVYKSLWGRPLHAIDCQGLFCEVDKYCRVAFPQLASNRSKIKAKYTPNPKKVDYFFPPKWGINEFVKTNRF